MSSLRISPALMAVKGESKHTKRVLLGVSGSVAAVKTEELVNDLLHHFHVDVVLTESSKHFVSKQSLYKCRQNTIDQATMKRNNMLAVYDDTDEWHYWQHHNDQVLHVALRKAADVLLLAPLSANTLAKCAYGLCDNLLSCIVRCWDFKHSSAFAAPAMNTLMYEHPFTSEHTARLSQLGFTFIGPVSKTLACGDTGNGAMQEPSEIVQRMLWCIGSS